MKFFVAFLFCLFFIQSMAQQSIVMNEEDIDIKIQTWHYQYYNNSKISKWTLLPKDGQAYYKAEFTWNNSSFESYYNENADVLFEREISTTNIPEPVTTLLDYRIVKYKISQFTKETLFKERQPVITRYKVDARTKTGGQVLYWFDGNFSIIPEVTYDFPFLD